MFRRRQSLSNQVRLIIAQSTAYYNPSIVSSLYQDSAGTTPVTADGDPVGLMLDLSGNGNDATQTTDANRPTYNLENSFHSTLYDGTNDYLDTGVTSMGDTGLFCDSGEQFCVAGAFRSSSTATGRKTIIAKAGGTGGSRTFHLFLNETNGLLRAEIRGTTTTIVNDAETDGEWHVFLLNWDGSTLTFLYDNQASDTVPVGTAAEETSENILIGARTTASPANHMNGDIGTTLILDKAMSDAEKTQLMRFLGQQYGVSV